MAPRIANRDSAPFIAARKPFTGSNFYGTTYGTHFGRLPRDWQATFYSDKPEYVVYSYATPVAWFGRNGWTVPDVKYSPSTGRQQSYVRAAMRSI